MFGRDIDTQILVAAKKTNEEICGVVVDNQVIFKHNKAENTLEDFLMDLPDEPVQAIFHSHPDGPFYPSSHDMQQQLATDVPWGIACVHPKLDDVFWFGDGVPKAPLIGRGFRHGVTDCYSLVRDFYSTVHGVSIMEVPRDWEWWGNQTLYADLFASAGFSEIPLEAILPGDGFLATIRSKTPNHAGVYLGNGLILHHTTGRHGYDPTRLSVVEPAARWLTFMDKVLRYEKSDIDRTVGQGIWP